MDINEVELNMKIFADLPLGCYAVGTNKKIMI